MRPEVTVGGARWRYSPNDRDWLDPDPTWAHTGDPCATRGIFTDARKMLVSVRYPQGLVTGYWTHDGKTKHINGSMTGWMYHPPRILPHKPSQAMSEIPAPDTFDPIRDIDASAFRPDRPWGVPSRRYLDTLTAKPPTLQPPRNGGRSTRAIAVEITDPHRYARRAEYHRPIPRHRALEFPPYKG